MRKAVVRAIIAVAIIAGAVASYAYDRREQASEARALSAALAGFITPSVAEDARALRAAYAAVLNRIDPLFGMDGTDPDRLAESVQDLDSYVDRIAALYPEDEKNLIRQVLHPVRFLEIIADAERARQRLIDAPSLEQARDYYRLLEEAIAAADEYAAALADVFRTHEAYAGYSVTFIGGWSSPAVFATALERYRSSLSEKRQQLRARESCLREFTDACPSLSDAFAALIAPGAVPEEGSQSSSIPRATREIIRIVRANLATSEIMSGVPGPIVALDDSPCFTDVQTAYYQSWRARSSSRQSFSLYYVNDLYFYDGKIFKGSRLVKEAEEDIPYLYQPAAHPYLCPSSGEDLTRAITLDAIYPLLASELPRAEDGIVYEAAARAALRSVAARLRIGERALAEDMGAEAVLKLEKALHIARERSPRFDEIIRDAMTNNYMIEVLAAREEPVPLAAVLLSRGYAFLLLLSYNGTVESEAPQLMVPSATDLLDSRLVSYNEFLRERYSPEEILSLMQAWRRAQFGE